MYDAEIAERYVRDLVREIESWQVSPTPELVDTVYFGGGTPSLLSPEQLQTIVGAVRQRFDVAIDAEVTIEINPGKINREKLAAFCGLGINRASFGLQTFDDNELARLGRSHDAEDARRTFAELREAGFDNISFDLIAGLPGQTMTGWQKNLDEAFSLRPEHLSFYLLEVHQGTPLAEHIKKGMQPNPDEDLAADMYEVMLDVAGANGYEHYEISNLCQPGFRSRHNTKYWTGAPYYGFGCSAHSYDGACRRWSNERDVLKYMEDIEQRGTAIVNENKLTEDERRAEAVFLGMRMMEGVSLSEYRRKFGADFRVNHEKDLQRFREAGLIELGDDLLKLTRHGALLSNEVFAAFV
jgi:putative oxygen-independent coproporphyrinogen III oxidase